MKHIRTHLSGRAVAAFALCGSLGLGLALSGPVAARAVTSDELQSQLDTALAVLNNPQAARMSSPRDSYRSGSALKPSSMGIPAWRFLPVSKNESNVTEISSASNRWIFLLYSLI